MRVIDIVCRLDLCFLTMVGWDNRGENAAAVSAAENQTLIPDTPARTKM